MGQLVNGKWQGEGLTIKHNNGQYIRQDAGFRNWITKDGKAGSTGSAGFKAQEGRYHLYVSMACPWAHRTLILRKLKGLENIISYSVVNAYMGENGWSFAAGDDVIEDDVTQADFLHQVYCLAKDDYTGRVSVPVLWDKQNQTIVSNESSEIIRMFNSAFDDIGATQGDYYPQELRAEIDALNTVIYDTVNNGVYKAGFATSQSAYIEAVSDIFSTLDDLDQRLLNQRYLFGQQITEADWRLFTTLVRFDHVYVGHFKCNKKRIADYPNLWQYLCDLYQVSGISETVKIEHIKQHYYQSQTNVNPSGIYPIGPEVDYNQPHNRAEKFSN